MSEQLIATLQRQLRQVSAEKQFWFDQAEAHQEQANILRGQLQNAAQSLDEAAAEIERLTPTAEVEAEVEAVAATAEA